MLGPKSFVGLLISAEFVWAVAYAMAGCWGLAVESGPLLGVSFLILALAAAELALGILLALLARSLGILAKGRPGLKAR